MKQFFLPVSLTNFDSFDDYPTHSDHDHDDIENSDYNDHEVIENPITNTISALQNIENRHDIISTDLRRSQRP